MLIAVHSGIHTWKVALLYVDWQSKADELLSVDTPLRKFKMFNDETASPS